ARTAFDNGDLTTGYTALGKVMHPGTDATSPRHRGFQDFGPEAGPLRLFGFLHVWGERNYPRSGSREQVELEATVQWFFDIAHRRADMPEWGNLYRDGYLNIPEKYLQEARENPAAPKTVIVVPPGPYWTLGAD